MEKCKRCGVKFEPQKGLKKYCSLSCRNTRNHSEETKRKIRKNTKIAMSQLSDDVKKHMGEAPNSPSAIAKRKQTWVKKLLSTNFEDLKYNGLRGRVILEQNRKCNKCGLDEWLGKPLTLELEHKDGNRSNNTRENLEALCPNCHSQTKTWRGKKSSVVGKNIVNDDELLKALSTKSTIRKALLSVGLSEGPNNYKRANRLMEQQILKGYNE